MIAVPPAARLTVVEDPCSEGTIMGVPLSAVKLTGKETGLLVVLLKYSAVYQPPPNTNCGRTCWTAPGDDGVVSVPLPESETVEVDAPVAVPEPFNVNVPDAPASAPVPPVMVTEPAPVADPPICGIRTPAGIEKVPTNTAPVGKISVKVPVIGPVFTPDNVAWLRFPAADNIAFPKPLIEPFPIMEKLVAVTRAAFPDNAIVIGALCPTHRPVARNKTPAMLNHPRFILLTFGLLPNRPSTLA